MKGRGRPLAVGDGYTDHNAKWLKPSKRPATQRAEEAAELAEEGSEDEPSADDANSEGALALHGLSRLMALSLRVHLYSRHHLDKPASVTSRIVAAPACSFAMSGRSRKVVVERRRAGRVVQ